MKSLLLLMALAGVAYADAFPHEGPCDDVAACEKACAKGKANTCYYGGVLVMQTAEEGRQDHAKKLFDKACTKGDAEGCYQSARIVAQTETGDPARPKTLAAFQKACTKSHARACFTYASMIQIPEEGGAKQEKLATDARKKGLSLMEQRCMKNKIASACDWASNLYGGVSWIKADPKKASALHERACQIRTGAACPPPPPPPPPPGNFNKRATPTEKQGADPGPPVKKKLGKMPVEDEAKKVDSVPTTITP